MTYYTREIETPKTKTDGLRNFVQMIVNEIEAGNHGEALMKAVDLLDDIGFAYVCRGDKPRPPVKSLPPAPTSNLDNVTKVSQ